MAEQTEKKTRRKSGPRQSKPMFAVVSYQDENGERVALNKAGLSIRLERDAAKLVDLVTSEDMSGATVVRVELPAPAQRATPAS